MNYYLLAAVVLVSLAAFVLFYTTAKMAKKGFGPYNTSTFLLLTVASLTATLAAVGKIDVHSTTSIMLAIIGFSGGLFAGRKAQDGEPPRV